MMAETIVLIFVLPNTVTAELFAAKKFTFPCAVAKSYLILYYIKLLSIVMAHK